MSVYSSLIVSAKIDVRMRNGSGSRGFKPLWFPGYKSHFIESDFALLDLEISTLMRQ